MKGVSFKQKIKYCLLLGLCEIIYATTTIAQTCHLYGRVLDDNGSPLEMVTIYAIGQPARTMTNLKGEYKLNIQSKDTVTIAYTLVGYETRKRTFSLPKDTIRMDIRLPLLGIRLDGATVVGQHLQTGTLQQIKAQNNALSPSTTGNGIEEIIATQAGVSTHNELSSQYNVRGGSFDENCVYLNGIEIFRPMLVRSGQQEGLSIINSDMVENIGFSSGGFSSCYGDKMSSVLDITYKEPKNFEAKAQASLLGASAYVGFGNKHFSWMNSIRYKTTRHLLSSLETSGEYNPQFIDYQSVFTWRPNSHWKLNIIGNFSDNQYNFKPHDRETNFGTLNDAKQFKVYFDGQEVDMFRTWFGAFTLTRNFGKNTKLSLQGSAYSTKEQETYDISGQYWLNEATQQEQIGVGTYMEHARNYLKAKVITIGLRFQSRFTQHHIQSGFDWKKEIIHENSREWEMRDSMGYSLPHSEDILQLIYSLRSQNKLQTHRFEGFIQDTWRFNAKMGLYTLNYGIRINYGNFNKEFLISPRISLGFLPKFNENLTFRFATGLYYQPPFYKELKDTTTIKGLTIANLNTNIRAQRSLHIVLGGDYIFRFANRPFRFTAEAYYKALSRLIPYQVDNVRIVYYGKNAAKGYATGIDFKLYGEFVPGADSWLTFSLMSTKECIDGRWIPRPTDQRYNISLHFTDFFPGTTRWRMTLKAIFADGLPFGAPHSSQIERPFRAPAYKRVDIGMSYRLLNNEDRHLSNTPWKFIKNIWIGLDVFNVLGINNVNSYYWVTDITNTQYAVPNYLTGRRLNARFSIDF